MVAATMHPTTSGLSNTTAVAQRSIVSRDLFVFNTLFASHLLQGVNK